MGLLGVAIFHAEALTADLAPHAIGALLLFMASIAFRDWWVQRIEIGLIENTRTVAALLQQSEQQLLKGNEQLAVANRELTKEMIARKHVQEELRHSQKMEAIGQLTGGVAHDFNNLLAVIVGNVDLLERTLEPDSSQRTYTQEATAAANRGAALTERLLAFSRKQALDARPIGVNDLLKSMTALLERTLGETIQLRLEMSADIAPCMADRAQLENAILNLVINARDAMHSGGLITIETSNVTLMRTLIEVSGCLQAGDYVSIAVRDTGIGMSAQVRARVFEPFFTTKEVGAGSGLGLSMVYGFVKTVRRTGLRSNPKRDRARKCASTSRKRDLPPDPIEDIDINSAPTGQRESVLVVEDDPALRKVIASFLEEQNYQVAAAPDGSEALAILDESRPLRFALVRHHFAGGILGAGAREGDHQQTTFDEDLAHVGLCVRRLRGRSQSTGLHANLLQKPFSMENARAKDTIRSQSGRRRRFDF